MNAPLRSGPGVAAGATARMCRANEIARMTLETFLLWIAIGLIAGWLASAVVGGGFGVIGDIVVGVVGAFLGSLLFQATGADVPFGGLPGTIFVAFIGAIVLLVLLRLVSRIRSRS